MKQCIYLLTLIVCWFFAHPSMASVGYVDLDQVLQKTNDGQSIQSKVKKEFETKRGQIQKQERKIQDEKMKLDEEAGLLSESERRKRAQKMQMRIMEFQRSVQANQKELADYEMKLITNMVEKMKPIIASLAKSKKLSKVERLNENILWIPADQDLTQQLITAYNKKHK